MTVCAFDPEAHAYTIGGRRVPSVTQVLGDLLPSWRASEFYLGRGQAVHMCAALVARGVPFEADPRIAGQVEAIRRFFREVQPEVIDIERRVYSEQYQFAGTLDLVACLPNSPTAVGPMVLDYKASLAPSTIYQCAAYAIAHPQPIDWGVGVEIRDDGTYRMSGTWDLRRAKREWLHLLGAYNIRARLGFTNQEDNGNE